MTIELGIIHSQEKLELFLKRIFLKRCSKQCCWALAIALKRELMLEWYFLQTTLTLGFLLPLKTPFSLSELNFFSWSTVLCWTSAWFLDYLFHVYYEYSEFPFMCTSSLSNIAANCWLLYIEVILLADFSQHLFS